MARRRRSLLLRALPWLLAAGLVAAVGHRLHLALALSDADIVDTARSLRVGDEPNEVPRDPRSALECLDPLLARDPEHYGALMEAARCWADLRHYDQAVVLLERASAAAPAEGQAVAAMRTAVHYLIRAERYDEAIDTARQVCELQPANLLLPLQHGAALLNASGEVQKRARLPFMSATKELADLHIEERIEAFVTDLWGEPDVEELIRFLAADADSAFQEALRQDLLYARRRFLEASDVLAAYDTFDGFDGSVAQEYTELLLRSGRLYDAYLEAALALRQPGVSVALAQNLRTVQAECAEVLEEWELAADIYQQVVDDWVARSNWCPPRFLSALLEMRVKAEQWDWILENERPMRRLIEDDPYIDFALACALHASGETKAAVDAMSTPFALISAGTTLPTSVRQDPHRRWDVLRQAVTIFEGAGDEQRALTALDRLLTAFPEDLEARRRRITIQRSRGYLEGAVDDAFRLLVPDRRDARDFELWLAIAEELSVQRHGQTLEQRAAERLDTEGELTEASAQAQLRAAQLAQRRRIGKTRRNLPLTESFPARDPALAYAVVRERLRRNQIELARNDARHLLQAHPGVQAFRYRLGRLLVREGKLDSAVEDFRTILEDVPGDTQTLDLTLRVERSLGHRAAAADLTNAIILADPTGAGSVQYARLLLERGLPQRAEKLLVRVIASNLDDPSPDVLLMVARAKLEQGGVTEATAILNALTTAYPTMEEVAMLGLELGLVADKPGVVTAALKILQPQAAGLFPDDMVAVAELLLEAGLFEELLTLFPRSTWEQPAERPALRHLARAAKAAGRLLDADVLLSLVDDTQAIRDVTLLHCLDDRPQEASRQLRLAPGTDDRAAELALCLMVSSVFSGSRVLFDEEPTEHLRELGVVDDLDAKQLELLDALLRILPSVRRLSVVLPQAVVEQPLETYPHAGPDVAKLIAVAREDPDAARTGGQALLGLLLAGDRPLWSRERRHLAELALHHVPGLAVPSVQLADWYLDADEPQACLDVLSPVLASLDLDTRALELFLAASDELGRPEWGLGLALGLVEPFPEVRPILARALLAQGQPREALEQFELILADDPDHVEALDGSLAVLGTLRSQGRLGERVADVLERHPTSLQLTHAAADALAELPQPDETSQALMARLDALGTEHLPLLVALARLEATDPEALASRLERASALVAASPPERESEQARKAVRALADATRLARDAGLTDLARQLGNQALGLEPGNLLMFRELARLELDAGHLDKARDYLAALSFIDRSDKEPPLILGQLLAEQVGQPHRGATVIRDAYPTAKPPAAVTILSAETFLRGDTVGALALFQELRANPLVTPDMVLQVARMALAGGHDDVADLLFNAFLTTAPKDHPGRPRAQALAALAKPVPGATAAAAQDKRRRAAAQRGDEAQDPQATDDGEPERNAAEAPAALESPAVEDVDEPAPLTQADQAPPEAPQTGDAPTADASAGTDGDG